MERKSRDGEENTERLRESSASGDSFGGGGRLLRLAQSLVNEMYVSHDRSENVSK